ncbi:hypothetical protein PY650_33030 [Rhizobium calliandrae]|uniref:Uncharacterized protein n=1 Tax=Rhizobium calliandrae TaxID=1312182 RepID=A0ABT7KNZ1_9HYPH|nr:hypothetical protein [Rhizobium calliandrae]MDL2410341.1 hypothetical protein [Rhizobium calliandrae]
MVIHIAPSQEKLTHCFAIAAAVSDFGRHAGQASAMPFAFKGKPLFE